MLSVNTGSLVIPRWSLKRNMTWSQAMGLCRCGAHSPPWRSSISALYLVTVPSPGPCSLINVVLV